MENISNNDIKRVRSQMAQEFPPSTIPLPNSPKYSSPKSSSSSTTTTTTTTNNSRKSPDVNNNNNNSGKEKSQIKLLRNTISSPSIKQHFKKSNNQSPSTNKLSSSQSKYELYNRKGSISVTSTPSEYSPMDISPDPYSPPYNLLDSPYSPPSIMMDCNNDLNSSGSLYFSPTNQNFSRSKQQNQSNKQIKVHDILSIFPEEISITIFAFLTTEDLYNCTRVCKNWKRLCEDEYIFKRICYYNYPCLKQFYRPPFELNWRKYYNLRKSSFLVLGGPTVQSSCMDDICTKLRSIGIENVDSFYTQKRIPTLEELQKYTGILIYSYNSSAFLDGQLMGDVLADYVDNGGGVVVTVFTNCSNLRNGFLKGRFNDQNYHPIKPDRQSDTNGRKPLTLGKVIEEKHPIMAGVERLEGGKSSFFCPGAINPEGQLIAEWSNGNPLVVELNKNKGKVVALNFFPPSSTTGDVRFWNASTDGTLLMANALTYVGKSRCLKRQKSGDSVSSLGLRDHHGEGASHSLERKASAHSLQSSSQSQQGQNDKKQHKLIGKRFSSIFKMFSKRI